MENIKEYNGLNESSYDGDKLYFREYVVKRLSKAPAYMRDYINKLPSIKCKDSDGTERICTRIPQVVYQYLYGSF